MSKDQPVPGDRIKAKKSALVQFTSTTLLLEVFLVLFATMVVWALRDSEFGRGPLRIDSGAVIWVLGGVLVLVLLVLSRAQGTPAGRAAGTVAQLPVLAMGFLVPMMFLVGGIFVVLWIYALRLGSRVDRERAEYDAAHPETAPNVP
ncbi:DUF4233 domain-containing protein [Promicromonospora kroppenstedtii]|uniref:DUF4233 domain-containing protein n=1 Tax=Promicromonospora kroppenstedtii TaxID=440482 RepID=UPI0004BAC0BC|nr:DUF4233 domain-containing protein [Promicromonospora kroppenstedtii]